MADLAIIDRQEFVTDNMLVINLKVWCPIKEFCELLVNNGKYSI